MEIQKVANGIFWVEIPEADLRILCGCPADSVKHLMKKGLIARKTRDGKDYETGPNAILLSDTSIQNGSFANLAEFPILQMLYRQGMILPGHPNNTGRRPMLIGLDAQVRSQSEYIFRGNYGLRSVEEITACGVPPEEAVEMFSIKKRFAFDRILATEELIEFKIVDASAVELRDGVFVHRKGFDRYAFLSDGRSLEVDLALGKGEEYESPYELNPCSVSREYFSIIHIGEGDGWDTRRSCMGSIVCFQGRLYLVDAGPEIHYSLTALGIGMNEIEGIFQTHAHDDHFAGLTSLMRSDRRLKYFAVPWVRASAMKKLAALMSVGEQNSTSVFDFQDLVPGVWNQVNGLEVRPVYSPHPVETTVLFFRVPWTNGYRTYTHLADLSSFEVLESMISDDPGTSGMSRSHYSAFVGSVLEPADVKKIDIGGGLIHGSAEDFAADESGKIILSHTSLPLTERQKEIGSSASFGQADVLIPAQSQNYLLRSLRQFLESYYPGIPAHEFDLFANCPVEVFNQGSIVLKKGGACSEVFMILSGLGEFIGADAGVTNRLSAGAMIGEFSSFLDSPSTGTYRAVSNMTVLKIPSSIYRDFIARNHLADTVRRFHENRQILLNNWLFGDLISPPMQNRIAQLMEKRSLRAGEDAGVPDGRELRVLLHGEIALSCGPWLIERVRAGDFWGEANIISSMPAFLGAQAARDSQYFAIPADLLKAIPIVMWKMMEMFDRRIKSFRSGFKFEWMDFFSVKVRELDLQHQRLFDLVNNLSESMDASGRQSGHEFEKSELISYARHHFEYEEGLMERHSFPGLEHQKKEHIELLNQLVEFLSHHGENEQQRPETAIEFLKGWLINHTLLEDHKYKDFLAEKGVQ